MLQVSWLISLQLIEHLGIILVLTCCITTCIANGGATRIWHVAVHCPPPPFGSPPRAQVYLSHVGFHILYVNIKIFSINNMFYVIQLLHSPVDHDGESSSHRNELTLRDSSSHSNQPSIGNTWAICMVTCLWCGVNWLCDEFDDSVMDLMNLWWIWWLCDGLDDFVMNLMTLWLIWWLCDECHNFVMNYAFLWYVNWVCINLYPIFLAIGS
jgi:hypothetical protein